MVALRADMDALPVVEQTGLRVPPLLKVNMKALKLASCMLVARQSRGDSDGVAEVLAGIRERIPGTVKFIFQPAEEGAPKGEDGGARMMIAEGALKNPDVDAIFRLHIGQQGGAGTASFRDRGFMASARRFDVIIRGQQTHGARPWTGLTRLWSAPRSSTLCRPSSVGKWTLPVAPRWSPSAVFMRVSATTSSDRATLSGTIRTFDPQTRIKIHERVHRIATASGQSQGTDVPSR